MPSMPSSRPTPPRPAAPSQSKLSPTPKTNAPRSRSVFELKKSFKKLRNEQVGRTFDRKTGFSKNDEQALGDTIFDPKYASDGIITNSEIKWMEKKLDQDIKWNRDPKTGKRFDPWTREGQLGKKDLLEQRDRLKQIKTGK
jgi:hypothetical protein